MTIVCQRAILLVLVTVLVTACAHEASPPAREPLTVPFPTAVLDTDAKLGTALAIVFTEGPAADAEGNVYYTEITGNRIIKYTPGGEWTEFRRPSRRRCRMARTERLPTTCAALRGPEMDRPARGSRDRGTGAATALRT